MIYQHRKPNLWKGILLLIGFAAMIMMYFVSCKSAPPADPCRHEKQNMQISVLQRALVASNDTISELRVDIDTLDFTINHLRRYAPTKRDTPYCILEITEPFPIRGRYFKYYRVYIPEHYKIINSGHEKTWFGDSAFEGRYHIYINVQPYDSLIDENWPINGVD